jgi:hypothetical protein
MGILSLPEGKEMNPLLWITTISFLLYCPVISWLDWKYHDIGTHKLWLPLIAVNLPILFWGYYSGLYSPVFWLISMIGLLLWFIVMQMRILPGADFVWLSLISIFMVLNPFTGLPFMLMFSFYLIGMTAAAMFGILLDKRLHHEKLTIHTVLDFPYLIPICGAFVLAVVMV